ncbi:MAG: class I mannose-6-phosphate isomerase [Muribaculaceae bacterium]|nr:class I mannose-6-phosphate isomerase [Muribaculaceae bacterium]
MTLAPITFVPYLKDVLWGGTKICRYKNIPCTSDCVGESWEISAVPGHESVVDSGEYEGLNLTDLINRFGAELLGEKVVRRYGLNFPLLVKIIDANQNLSVQVHPNDELAEKRHQSLGKTEMWYIIQADKGAKIFAGLNTAMTPDDYVRRVADGTFAETLAVHDSYPGDVFFLPAGRVHAIGAGNLLAEIQENSDVTYRIYDYDRRDADGNPRQLHTELAKDAIDFTLYDNLKSNSPSDSIPDAEIVSCNHFSVHRAIVNGESELSFSPDSFTVLMCLDGLVRLVYPIGEMLVSAGQTVLLPAGLSEIQCFGQGLLLTAQC